MGYTVPLRDLAGMTPAEENRVLTELVQAAKSRRNGQAAIIASRVRQFEQRYELTSEAMIERLKRGEMRETTEIAEWLFLLGVRNSTRSG